jgi:hypothetical protein
VIAPALVDNALTLLRRKEAIRSGKHTSLVPTRTSNQSCRPSFIDCILYIYTEFCTFAILNCGCGNSVRGAFRARSLSLSLRVALGQFWDCVALSMI